MTAVPAHLDAIPLTAAGTVAKLVKEGYTGYLVRATNDDMGDAPGLGTPGTFGQNVLGNERYNDEVPTQFLRMLLRSGKMVVVCLMKMRESDAPAFLAHFQR